MMNIFRKNKTPTLQPEKELINVDINFKEYDPVAIGTIISISAIFLISTKLFILAGPL